MYFILVFFYSLDNKAYCQIMKKNIYNSDGRPRWQGKGIDREGDKVSQGLVGVYGLHEGGLR